MNNRLLKEYKQIAKQNEIKDFVHSVKLENNKIHQWNIYVRGPVSNMKQ